MPIVHINKPPIIESSIRLLPKYKRRFVKDKFKSLEKAIKYGLKKYPNGFRIFYQSCYEWYEPSNILLAKVENINNEVIK